MGEAIRIRALSDSDREAIATWRYPGELAIYDPRGAAAELCAPDHVAPASADGTLLGYGSFGPEGQVPGGRYDASAIDLGMGLRPDLVGRGLGPRSNRIVMDGGTVGIDWDPDSCHVVMTGPVAYVCDGVLSTEFDRMLG